MIYKLWCDAAAIDLSEEYKLHKPKALDSHQVDFWLAMGKAGEKTARKLVKKAGEPPEKGLYYNAFPDKVGYCGFVVPPLPFLGSFDKWLDFLREHLAPWRDRFGQAMEDAS